MKHSLLNNSQKHILGLFFVFIMASSCEHIENLQGKRFTISSEAKKYFIDTTSSSITMKDNVGFNETFYTEKSTFKFAQVPQYHYIEYIIGSGNYTGAFTAEKFGITYKSLLNNYYFRYLITSEVENQLEICWSEDSYNFSKREYEDNNRFVYNFKTKKVTSKLKPLVVFHDSIIVSDIKYKNIIEIDYSKIKNKINENTPLKIYFASKAGLIKYVPQEGIVVERIK